MRPILVQQRVLKGYEGFLTTKSNGEKRQSLKGVRSAFRLSLQDKDYQLLTFQCLGKKKTQSNMLLWETHNNVGSYYDIICGKVFFFFFSHLKAQCFNDTYPGLSWID